MSRTQITMRTFSQILMLYYARATARWGENHMSSLARRRFLGLAAGVATGAAFAQSEKPVRIGMVGVGHRGSYLLTTLLDLPDVHVPPICDINAATPPHAHYMLHKPAR